MYRSQIGTKEIWAFHGRFIRGKTSIDWLVKKRIGRCHPLYGDRLGQYAMDLIQPYRLIFTQYDNTVDIVEIQEIVDYH